MEKRIGDLERKVEKGLKVREGREEIRGFRTKNKSFRNWEQEGI